jgi:hypothetical protein
VSRTLVTAASAVLLSVALYPPCAHAYIDPGTGSLILQGLIAAFVGAAFALKNFYYTKVKRVIDFVLGRKPAEPPSDGDAPSSTPPPAAKP